MSSPASRASRGGRQAHARAPRERLDLCDQRRGAEAGGDGVALAQRARPRPHVVGREVRLGLATARVRRPRRACESAARRRLRAPTGGSCAPLGARHLRLAAGLVSTSASLRRRHATPREIVARSRASARSAARRVPALGSRPRFAGGRACGTPRRPRRAARARRTAARVSCASLPASASRPSSTSVRIVVEAAFAQRQLDEHRVQHRLATRRRPCDHSPRASSSRSLRRREIAAPHGDRRRAARACSHRRCSR